MSDENFRIVKETDKPSGSENIFVQVRAYISYHKHYLHWLIKFMETVCLCFENIINAKTTDFGTQLRHHFTLF